MKFLVKNNVVTGGVMDELLVLGASQFFTNIPQERHLLLRAAETIDVRNAQERDLVIAVRPEPNEDICILVFRAGQWTAWEPQEYGFLMVKRIAHHGLGFKAVVSDGRTLHVSEFYMDRVQEFCELLSGRITVEGLELRKLKGQVVSLTQQLADANRALENSAKEARRVRDTIRRACRALWATSRHIRSKAIRDIREQILEPEVALDE